MNENKKNLVDLIDYSDVASQIVTEVNEESLKRLKRNQFWEEKESGNIFSIGWTTENEIVLVDETNLTYGEQIRVPKKDFFEKYKFLRNSVIKLENNFKILIIDLCGREVKIKVSSIDAIIIDSKDSWKQPIYSIVFNGYKFTVEDEQFSELFNSEKEIFKRIALFDN